MKATKFPKHFSEKVGMDSFPASILSDAIPPHRVESLEF